jgi:hypothetical protein
LTRDTRFDLPVLLGGVVGCAGAATTGAFALARVNRPGSDLGPTAATLTDAWNVEAGAGLGLLVGAAVVAAVARRGPRVVTGILAGAGACILDVLVFAIASRPSDLSFGDTFGFTLVLSSVEILPILIGAALGAVIGDTLERYRQRQSAGSR